jgi:hypothetical protein
MQRSSFAWILLVLCTLAFPSFVQAESPSSSDVPEGAKFVLNIDVDAIREESKLGKMLFELVKTEALKEIAEKTSKGNEEGKDPNAGYEKITEMLGFDPFTEIQSLTVSAGDYEHPEKSLTAIVRMKQTTGNLEGLMLGLPGYEATDYGDLQIHSISPDSDQRIYGAIVGGSNGKAILVSSDKEELEHMIDQNGEKRTSKHDKQDSKPLTSGHPLVTLRVLDIPLDKIGEGPQANIAKLLNSIAIEVSEKEDDLSIGLLLSTAKEPQAEQIRQMAQGLIAMIDFAQSAEPDDEDLKKVKELTKEITANRDGSEVSVGIRVSSKKVMKLIEEEMGSKE